MMEMWILWLAAAAVAGMFLGFWLYAEQMRAENERLRQLLGAEAEARHLLTAWMDAAYLRQRRRQ